MNTGSMLKIVSSNFFSGDVFNYVTNWMTSPVYLRYRQSSWAARTGLASPLATETRQVGFNYGSEKRRNFRRHACLGTTGTSNVRRKRKPCGCSKFRKDSSLREGTGETPGRYVHITPGWPARRQYEASFAVTNSRGKGKWLSAREEMEVTTRSQCDTSAARHHTAHHIPHHSTPHHTTPQHTTPHSTRHIAHQWSG
jgi:hypothetical protein